MIVIDSVSKHYDKGVRALSDISLRVPKGEFITIMGPSGSGKSTLLHLMGALDQPSSGRVVLAGQDISLLADKPLTLFRRKHLGFVFQFFNLLPTMTAAENAALPAMLAGVPAREAEAQARVLLERVGLGKRGDHRPDELSGGEMQRVAIARALVNAPSIVLADEPTGNLDSASGGEVLALLRSACEERGVTVVMVTHDANAARAGHRLLRLRDGRIEDDSVIARAASY
jgi:putative ABC transport system ATP-binding protein